MKAFLQELGRDGASYFPKERGERGAEIEREKGERRRREAERASAGQWGRTGAREDQLTLGTLVV